MKKTTSITAIFIIIFATLYTNPSQANPTRYKKVPAGYIMVLRQGDNIGKELEKLTIKENILSANFTGMGFVNITFGFFNAKERRFDPKEFNNVELASMNGTIAWQKGKPSIHMHGVVTDASFQAFGGHIISGVVGTGSLEIMIIVHDQKLERVFDEGIGGNVLSLD